MGGPLFFCFVFFGGGLTTMKSVLKRIPTYFLSCFPLQSLVAAKLEAIQVDFLWGSFGNDLKYHPVRWNIIKFPMLNESLV